MKLLSDITYPFPDLGKFDYTLPHHIETAKQEIMWDKDIKYVAFETRQPSGVYIWHENHHGRNKVLYVGHSEKLLTRLSQHCHGRKHYEDDEDDMDNYSPVREYIFNRPDEDLEACSKYPEGCDCIPRFFARVFFDLGRKEELELIHLLRPILSGQIRYWDKGRGKTLVGSILAN